MDIKESIYLIEETLEEYQETKIYDFYIQCIDKEKFNSYEAYKKALQEEHKKTLEIVDLEERKTENRQILKAFLKGRE